MSDKLPAQRVMDRARKEVDGWPSHKGTPKVRAEVARLRQLPAQRVIEAARKWMEPEYDGEPEGEELIEAIEDYEDSDDPGVVVSGDVLRGLIARAAGYVPGPDYSPDADPVIIEARAALGAKR